MALDSTGAHEIMESLQSPDLGHPNVQFCIFVDGNSMLSKNRHDGHSVLDLAQCPQGMYFLKA